MKRSTKLTFGILLTIPFLMSLGCPRFQRSPCRYEEKKVKAYISDYEVREDSTMIVWFKAVDKQKSWVWDVDDKNRTDIRMHSSEFEEYDLSIDVNTVADTSILYLVEGSFILKGTCGPETIYKVEKLNDVAEGNTENNTTN